VPGEGARRSSSGREGAGEGMSRTPFRELDTESGDPLGYTSRS
jgi:hypothetical protein